MSLVAFGFNHLTAPVELRERIAFPSHQLPEALNEVCASLELAEAAILSTCNRTELYCWTPGADSERLVRWLGDYQRVEPPQLVRSSYVHRDEAAARHAMRVAAGLDSMVVGEPQILGQVKEAWDIARQAGTLGPQLERLSQHALTTAKRVRNDTDIGRHPVSVAYAAVRLAQQIFADLSRARALLVGAGETSELVARHLCEAGLSDLVVANRTLVRARELAAQHGGDPILLSDLGAALPSADIVIASTAAELPLLGKGLVESALRQRKRRPMFMVDLAVPRDIEPQVGELEDVFLYTVDDLSELVEENRHSRAEAAREAEALILEGVERYMRELRSRDAVETIKAYRGSAEALRAQELERHLERLRRGETPEQVLAGLAHSLTRKLTHAPTVGLREAGASGRDDLLAAGRRLLGLDDDPADERASASAGAPADQPAKPDDATR